MKRIWLFICLVIAISITLFASVTSHAATICSWDKPGADRYTGTAADAINMMRDIPANVRFNLIERAERHQYDDVIMIDSGSIRGKHEYAPALRSMVFGSKGRQCDTVTRNWAPEHVESAMVYCEGNYCVAMPAVCGNWSRVERLARGYVAREKNGIDFSDSQGDFAMGWAVEAMPRIDFSPEPTQTPVFAEIVPLSDAYIGSSTFGEVVLIQVSTPPIGLPPPVVTLVPEPGTWVLLLSGLFIVIGIAKRERNK